MVLHSILPYVSTRTMNYTSHPVASGSHFGSVNPNHHFPVKKHLRDVQQPPNSRTHCLLIGTKKNRNETPSATLFHFVVEYVRGHTPPSTDLARPLASRSFSCSRNAPQACHSHAATTTPCPPARRRPHQLPPYHTTFAHNQYDQHAFLALSYCVQAHCPLFNRHDIPLDGRKPFTLIRTLAPNARAT